MSTLFCVLSLSVMSYGQLAAGQKASDPASPKSMIADHSCPSCEAQAKKDDGKKATEPKSSTSPKSIVADASKEPNLQVDVDQTDTLAIPLDTSEEEEAQEMQSLENEQAKLAQKKKA